MKIACTGLAPGRIASELISRGVEFISADVTDPKNFRLAVEDVNPDIVIHTAALTDVDECEQNPKKAFDVNVLGVNALTSWFPGKVILISTDHVFSGKKWFGGGYSERHNPDPVNTYGLTKYSGETIAFSGKSKVVVIRTSKVFSQSDLQVYFDDLHEQEPTEFTDLIKRAFVSVENFVNGLFSAVDKFNRLPPILNISGTGIYSYAEFWRGVCRAYGFDESLIIGRKKKLRNVTPRPFRGGLNASEARRLGIPLFDAFDGM